VVPVVDGLGALESVVDGLGALESVVDGLWALEIAVAQKPYVREQCYMLVVPWR
jgi:hypothetical protein